MMGLQLRSWGSLLPLLCYVDLCYGKAVPEESPSNHHGGYEYTYNLRTGKHAVKPLYYDQYLMPYTEKQDFSYNPPSEPSIDYGHSIFLPPIGHTDEEKSKILNDYYNSKKKSDSVYREIESSKDYSRLSKFTQDWTPASPKKYGEHGTDFHAVPEYMLNPKVKDAEATKYEVLLQSEIHPMTSDIGHADIFSAEIKKAQPPAAYEISAQKDATKPDIVAINKAKSSEKSSLEYKHDINEFETNVPSKKKTIPSDKNYIENMNKDKTKPEIALVKRIEKLEENTSSGDEHEMEPNIFSIKKVKLPEKPSVEYERDAKNEVKSEKVHTKKEDNPSKKSSVEYEHDTKNENPEKVHTKKEGKLFGKPSVKYENNSKKEKSQKVSVKGEVKPSEKTSVKFDIKDEEIEEKNVEFSSITQNEMDVFYHERDPSKEDPTVNTNEQFNIFQHTENGEFDLERVGSVTSGDEAGNIEFSNVDKFRNLAFLNSNIWSLVFNPNAKDHNLKTCFTRSNETGYCMYVQQCPVQNIASSLEQLLNNACVVDDVFIGVCCPEFPVETVKVQWDDSERTSNQVIDELNHETEGELIMSWCDGYEKSLSNLLTGSSLADCGTRSNEASNSQSWPWKAPLVSMSNGKIFCGGVIIGEEYILTAAHCTTKIPRNQILVRVGQHDESSGENFAVTEIKRHAQYNPRTLHNDIALLKLGRRLAFGKHANMICLPEDGDDSKDGLKATLLGWQGVFGENPKKSETLEIISNEECRKTMNANVPHSMLCTEARNEDERTCNADSGAPLVIEDDGKYEVIGILSWNRNDCDQRFPSIFSRVSSYLKWVEKHAV